MGLDTTHGCWHGPYSAFMAWREELAKVAGIPLRLMTGFYESEVEGYYELSDYKTSYFFKSFLDRVDSWCPIAWEALRPDILHVLLHHSDSSGSIEQRHCEALAARLEEIMPQLPEGGDGHRNFRDKTRLFVDGLRRAAAAGQDVGFG